MGGMFSGPKMPPLPAPVPAPKVDDPAVEEARRKEVIAARKAKGRAATLLTGADGIISQPSLQNKSLLGK